MDGDPRLFEKNVVDLRECLQDVLNDAMNRGRAGNLEAMSALSSLLVKITVSAGIDLEDFMEGLEMLFVVQASWEDLEPETLH